MCTDHNTRLFTIIYFELKSKTKFTFTITLWTYFFMAILTHPYNIIIIVHPTYIVLMP